MSTSLPSLTHLFVSDVDGAVGSLSWAVELSNGWNVEPVRQHTMESWRKYKKLGKKEIKHEEIKRDKMRGNLEESESWSKLKESGKKTLWQTLSISRVSIQRHTFQTFVLMIKWKRCQDDLNLKSFDLASFWFFQPYIILMLCSFSAGDRGDCNRNLKEVMALSTL